jgi:hypothetical protein
MTFWNHRRPLLVPALLAAALSGGVAIVGTLKASDHQDTPEVELSPRYDVNDVYAFPSPTTGRIVLVLGTQSPITPEGTRTASFGTKDQTLYQLKIDNDGDIVEDLVLQATFTGSGPQQRIVVRGPMKPNETGTANTLLGGEPTVSGPVN